MIGYKRKDIKLKNHLTELSVYSIPFQVDIRFDIQLGNEREKPGFDRHVNTIG